MKMTGMVLFRLDFELEIGAVISTYTWGNKAARGHRSIILEDAGDRVVRGEHTRGRAPLLPGTADVIGGGRGEAGYDNEMNSGEKSGEGSGLEAWRNGHHIPEPW
jgi:hypothetical protein